MKKGQIHGEELDQWNQDLLKAWRGDGVLKGEAQCRLVQRHAAPGESFAEAGSSPRKIWFLMLWGVNLGAASVSPPDVLSSIFLIRLTRWGLVTLRTAFEVSPRAHLCTDFQALETSGRSWDYVWS